MAFGKMRTTIDILTVTRTVDSSGFAVENMVVIFTTRAYFEQRGGSKSWANLASFSDATALFRFRKGNVLVDITNRIQHGDDIYIITDLQEIGNMYYEALVVNWRPAKK